MYHLEASQKSPNNFGLVHPLLFFFFLSLPEFDIHVYCILLGIAKIYLVSSICAVLDPGLELSGVVLLTLPAFLPSFFFLPSKKGGGVRVRSVIDVCCATLLRL